MGLETKDECAGEGQHPSTGLDWIDSRSDRLPSTGGMTISSQTPPLVEEEAPFQIS
jgi:hypothetical protein